MLEGVSKLEKYYPVLKESIVIKIGLVCAGMASRLRTKKFILENTNIRLSDIKKIRYRGNGWPGYFTVYGKKNKILFQQSVLDKLGPTECIVSKDHYLRCNLCLDHWSSRGDISVSDPWSKSILNSEKLGKTALITNTDRGKEIIRKVCIAEDFDLTPISNNEMYSFNSHFILKKTNIHSWLWFYQVLFMKRYKYIILLLLQLTKRKLVGVKTILKTYNEKNYYY